MPIAWKIVVGMKIAGEHFKCQPGNKKFQTKRKKVLCFALQGSSVTPVNVSELSFACMHQQTTKQKNADQDQVLRAAHLRRSS
jgi:hypothetical protein